MSFHASQSSTHQAIRVKINIYSAVLPHIEENGVFKKKLKQPTAYVKLKCKSNQGAISNSQSWTSTAKSRSQTTNPNWDENIMITWWFSKIMCLRQKKSHVG